jgi:hypothetical protein
MRRAAVLAALALSCSGDLAPPELIANLRILAVRAEPPEGVVGTEVALDALVVAPDARAAAQRAWVACVSAAGTQVGPQACAQGGTPVASCAADPEASACLLGSGDTATYRLPAKARAGRAAAELGQVFILLVAAEGSVADCVAALTTDGAVPDPCRISAKRIDVPAAPPATPNTNPTVGDLRFDGDKVRVTVPAGAADPTPDGREALYLSWFVTAGALDTPLTDATTAAGLENTWTPAGQAGTIWVVVRDGRGGQGWAVAQR